MSAVCGDVVVLRNDGPGLLKKYRGDSEDDGCERGVGEGLTGGADVYWTRGKRGRGIGTGRRAWAAAETRQEGETAGLTWAHGCPEASFNAAESDVLERARSPLIEVVGSASRRFRKRRAR